MALNWILNECYIYKNIKLKKKKKGATRAGVYKDIEPATKALVVSEPIVIFHPRDRKF